MKSKICGLRCQNVNLICDTEAVRTMKSKICGLRSQNVNLICDIEVARTIKSMICGLRCQNPELNLRFRGSEDHEKHDLWTSQPKHSKTYLDSFQWKRILGQSICLILAVVSN